jgi:hypothetical protein
VGHIADDEDPLSNVRGTDRGSRYNFPLRVIPEAGKVAENFVKAFGAEAANVLTHDVGGSKVANKTGELGPEVARVFLRAPPPGEAERLAGKSSNKDICSGGIRPERAYVRKARDFRPVLREDAAAVRVDFALPDAAHARSFESKVDPSNACEQASESQHGPTPSAANSQRSSARALDTLARLRPIRAAISAIV